MVGVYESHDFYHVGYLRTCPYQNCSYFCSCRWWNINIFTRLKENVHVLIITGFFYSLWCLFNYYSKCIKLLKITELQVEKK